MVARFDLVDSLPCAAFELTGRGELSGYFHLRPTPLFSQAADLIPIEFPSHGLHHKPRRADPSCGKGESSRYFSNGTGFSALPGGAVLLARAILRNGARSWGCGAARDQAGENEGKPVDGKVPRHDSKAHPRRNLTHIMRSGEAGAEAPKERRKTRVPDRQVAVLRCIYGHSDQEQNHADGRDVGAEPALGVVCGRHLILKKARHERECEVAGRSGRHLAHVGGQLPAKPQSFNKSPEKQNIEGEQEQ